MIGHIVTIDLRCRIGSCKVALAAILLHNQTATSDSRYWHDIWVKAYLTLIHCVDIPRGIGGYHNTGAGPPSDLLMSSNSEGVQS